MPEEPAINRVFLKLAGVDGDSIDHAHLKWLDIDNWSWGIDQPRSWVAKSKRNQSAAFGTPQKIRFEKPPDASSAVLLQKCVEGAYLDTGELEVWSANQTLTRALIKLKLKDVTVTSITTGTGTHGQLDDKDEIAYGVVEWDFQTLGGGAATGGWDFEKNKKP
jgi:type VI protein secretion system component Hcp